MLSLKSLTFSSIGRFVEEQTLNFDSLGSLVQVDAVNNNTGGSSGAGKSTIFKALEFLLGLNDTPNGVLQSRLTKTPMSVTGLFDFDGQPLKIERGKKLLIDLNGKITTGSSKLAEEELDVILGMPRDLFRKILHKRQGEGGFFLQMGPSDTHKFFIDCLGQEQEQSKVTTLDNRLEVLSDKETDLKSAVESSKSALEATQKAISSLGVLPILEVTPEVISALNGAYNTASEQHKTVKALLKAELEELEKTRPQITSSPFDRTKIEQLESEIGTIFAQISELEKKELNRQSQVKQSLSKNKIEYVTLQNIIKEGNRAKEEAVKLAEELKKIKASICPTCEQSWTNDAAKAKESSILAKLQDYKKSVVAGMEANAKLAPLEEECKRLELESRPQSIPEAIELKMKMDFKSKELSLARQEERDHQNKENARNQSVSYEFNQKHHEMRMKHQLAIQDAQDAENRAYGNLQAINNQIKSYEDAKRRFEESSNKLQAQLSKYQEELYCKNAELYLVMEEIELAQESKKAIKSYLSASFEDALDSIGDMATRFIRSIPNMSTATISFEGLKETKEGKIKEEVTCTISMDGEIGIPIKSLSGGERSSTDLAIDLSVIKLIEERTGKGIDLFVLDEPFTGLDSQNILEALEMLKECSSDKRLLIVDHNPIAAQSIESRLTVIRDGLTSRIVQQ